ncbi:hypothetical protein D3C87_1877740 [compost metagenome]
MGKRPLLAGEIADILHLDADFLHRLTLYTVLQRFTRLHESGNQPVHIVHKMRGVCEQNPVVLKNRGNDRRGNPGIADQSAGRTTA